MRNLRFRKTKRVSTRTARSLRPSSHSAFSPYPVPTQGSSPSHPRSPGWCSTTASASPKPPSCRRRTQESCARRKPSSVVLPRTRCVYTVALRLCGSPAALSPVVMSPPPHGTRRGQEERRQRFARAKNQLTEVTPGDATPHAAACSPASSAAHLRVTLPDGRVLTHSFSATETLATGVWASSHLCRASPCARVRWLAVVAVANNS